MTFISLSLSKKTTLFVLIVLILPAAQCTSPVFGPVNSIGADDDISKQGQGVDEKKQVVISPQMIDLYLENPGIGWQHDLDLVSSSFLPETVAYGNRIELTWEDLNPADGLYDWSPLDNERETAVASGKQFSFRVITMLGEIYGGHKVPGWVIEKGAVITSSGEPDYANCIYQQEWGEFVSALANRYDGIPDIAFIDISGYGNFNEWSWGEQTEWDSLWEVMYGSGNATPDTMEILDSQARRRLADMFLGGEIEEHQCRDQNNKLQNISYFYNGFQRTQLVMPYAGVVQSVQYVFTMRNDIGFRYDCLGRETEFPEENVSDIWRSAPIVYEFCSPAEFNLDIAQQDLQITHGSLVHNNGYELAIQDLQQLMLKVGYRYYLKEAQFSSPWQAGEELPISMTWQNVGSSPSYPRMGQVFQLHLYLLDDLEQKLLADFPLETDVSAWMPADPLNASPPDYQLDTIILVPDTLTSGDYLLKVAIIDQRTGSPIRLAFDGADELGRYFLSKIKIVAGGN
jgi:hypothetical protein